MSKEDDPAMADAISLDEERKKRREGKAADPKQIADVITRFNAQYMVIADGGKTLVYERKHDPTLNRNYYASMSFDDFHKLYLNKRMVAGLNKKDEPIIKSFANIWLEHPQRHQYAGGMIFDPSRKHEREDVLNLWQGFPVEPVQHKGGWSLLQDHMRKIICAGNKGYYDYLMGWMARLAQRPGEQGEVAVVMCGGKGSGKGIVAKALLRLFGPHGLHISNRQHLIGRFNEHLRNNVFLFVDEALYAGDKSHAGILQALITEATITIEAKYKAAQTFPSCVHMMMASNEAWVVPASADERRYFVLEVLGVMIGKFAYFEAILAQLEDGGYEAMLYDLLHYPLNDFNVRRVPHTEGLDQQRGQSLDTTHAWWEDVLHRGYVYKSKLGLEEDFRKWFRVVATELLYESYLDFAKQRHERRLLTRELLGKFFTTKLGYTPCRLSNDFIGEHLSDVTLADGTNRRKAKPVYADRPRGYALGSLRQAREAFEAASNRKVAWPVREEKQGRLPDAEDDDDDDD